MPENFVNSSLTVHGFQFSRLHEPCPSSISYLLIKKLGHPSFLVRFVRLFTKKKKLRGRQNLESSYPLVMDHFSTSLRWSIHESWEVLLVTQKKEGKIKTQQLSANTSTECICNEKSKYLNYFRTFSRFRRELYW